MNSDITRLEQTISTLEAQRATLGGFVIAGGGEGNPFYMEELAKILIEGPVIDTSWDLGKSAWVWPPSNWAVP